MQNMFHVKIIKMHYFIASWRERALFSPWDRWMSSKWNQLATHFACFTYAAGWIAFGSQTVNLFDGRWWQTINNYTVVEKNAQGKQLWWLFYSWTIKSSRQQKILIFLSWQKAVVLGWFIATIKRMFSCFDLQLNVATLKQFVPPLSATHFFLCFSLN